MQTLALRRPQVTHSRFDVFVSHEHLNRSQVHAGSLQGSSCERSPEFMKLPPRAAGVTRLASFTMAAAQLLSLDDSFQQSQQLPVRVIARCPDYECRVWLGALARLKRNEQIDRDW